MKGNILNFNNKIRASEQYGTPCEFILKDISTVNYQPQRLSRWSELVKSVIENY